MFYTRKALFCAICTSFIGCQAGSKPGLIVKSANDNTLNQTTVDNSRKEMTTTTHINPQIAKTIQNIYNSSSESLKGTGFHEENIIIVANNTVLGRNEYIGTALIRLKKDEKLVMQIFNGNSGEGSTLQDAMLSLDIPSADLRIVGPYPYPLKDSTGWLGPSQIHPTEINRKHPQSFDTEYYVMAATGTYNASFHITSKDKPEIIREFNISLE